jgi:3-hydroxyisobutyrate dehydrogenase-like beta-hydroxyacid dehydrogenase
MAQELHVPVFTMQASHTVYEIAMQQGLANLDYASIAKLWESWGGLSFKTK